MNYLTNVWKLYVIRFFQSLIPAYVIERLFWEERGITVQEVVYTEVIFAVTIVLLEIPSGIVADKWGRKNMILLSSVLEAIMFFLLINSTEFWHFAIAIFLSGLAGSANSGAENALLYDSLLLSKKEKSFEKYLGRVNSFALISAILAALSGSFLANKFDFEVNYWLSVISMLVSACVAVMLVEPITKNQSTEHQTIMGNLKISIHFFMKNTNVCLVVLAGIAIGAALNFVWEFWQLYLNRLDISIHFFGFFLAALMLLTIPGNLLAHAVIKRYKYRSVLITITAIITVGFIFISIKSGYTGFTAMCIIVLASGFVEPIVSGYLHHRIDSCTRATIDSFQSLGLNAMLILVGLGFGYFSSYYDVFGGYAFIALISGVFLVYFLFASKEIIDEQVN